MRICPITYEEISQNQRYSRKGLQLLSPRLNNLNDFPYSAEEQRQQSEVLASKLSIQGVQPKISAKLSIKESTFEISAKGGRFILKPQVYNFKNLPENEDLTMRLASAVKIEVPLHGLIYSKDGSMTYFIKRFDRSGQKTKLHIEDFAQLNEESRDTKYNSTMEKVAKTVTEFCTFPIVEHLKLLKLTIFSFLVGNEDLHLKNFSIIVREGKVEFSPAYDLLNTAIALISPKEELALSLNGKKNKVTQNDLFDYFGKTRLGLPEAVIRDLIDTFKKAKPEWINLINRSFLPQNLRDKYLDLVNTRLSRLDL